MVMYPKSEASPAQEEISGNRNPRAPSVICEETVHLALRRYHDSLRAIVLTGSLARDEATFVQDSSRSRLLGDADFFLVFHDGRRLPPSSEVTMLAREIGNALRDRGLDARMGLAPVHGAYFRNMPRRILTYELRVCGRVVWGDPSILSLVPEFAAAEISLEDAWRLLGNRIVELLAAVGSAAETPAPRAQAIGYTAVKFFLDMATSYLVFTRHYCPTYRERERALSNLGSDPVSSSDAPFPLAPFAARVSECTAFKLSGQGSLDASTSLWEEAVQFAYILWKWELSRLTGEPETLSHRELMSRWMKRQPVSARVRGWLSAIRRYGWRRSWREWPRWALLAREASPRYWVYSVAAEVFFELPAKLPDASPRRQPDPGRRSLARNLPILREDEGLQPGASPLSRLAALVELNYKRFLETTQA
jgi:hypothetical protein